MMEVIKQPFQAYDVGLGTLSYIGVDTNSKGCPYSLRCCPVTGQHDLDPQLLAF
jgi:hypothetical protein